MIATAKRTAKKAVAAAEAEAKIKAKAIVEERMLADRQLELAAKKKIAEAVEYVIEKVVVQHVGSNEKVTLYALKKDRDAILLNLQRDGNVMLISQGEGSYATGADDLFQSRNCKRCNQICFSACGYSFFLAKKTPVAYDKFLRETGEGAELSKQVDSLAEKIASLRNGSTLLAQAEHLQPWLELDVPLEELKDTDSNYFVCRLFAGYRKRKVCGRTQ